MRFTRVTLGRPLAHVVKGTDIESRSLCGQSPWPGRWSTNNTESLPLCMGCANVLRKAQK